MSVLREELARIEQSKIEGQESKSNFWYHYVLETFDSAVHDDAESFVAQAKRVANALAEERPLTKNEKNSLASAKSVLKKCAAQNVSPYVLEADGTIAIDENGARKVRGKSELQEEKTAYQKLMQSLGAAKKILEGEIDLSKAECEALGGALLDVAGLVSKHTAAAGE